jgi:hypothetical protein
MAKTLTVYMNDVDLELLGNLKKVLNIEEEGRVMKLALKHLGNDHLHGEPAPEMIQRELIVEIPTDVRLRAMIKQARAELKREAEQRKATEVSQKKQEEDRKKAVEGLMEWFKR